jgi:ABC-type Fe3+/spermidine/putrescine transport system ATPase subunit
MSGLEIREVHKSFNGKKALEAVSFRVSRGEIVALLGPSGSGKSTILNIIAGVESPDQGEVIWDGNPLLAVPVHRRGFGFMFQDYMLFPHMNVFDNVAFGLRMSGWEMDQIARRVYTMLELVGLPGFEKRNVTTLSGGEQQRVALARALAPRPKLLLLDEPLGALDRLLRERLVVDLQRILQEMSQTAIYVTHDQEEAFVIADRVVLLDQGRVVQQGTPAEIYWQPRNEFVARFLGMENIFPAQISSNARGIEVKTVLGEWTIPLPGGTLSQSLPAGETVKVLLRPDAVTLDEDATCRITAEVVASSFRGQQQRVIVEAHGQRLVFELPSRLSVPKAGQPVEICFEPQQAIQILSA